VVRRWKHVRHTSVKLQVGPAKRKKGGGLRAKSEQGNIVLLGKHGVLTKEGWDGRKTPVRNAGERKEKNSRLKGQQGNLRLGIQEVKQPYNSQVRVLVQTLSSRDHEDKKALEFRGAKGLSIRLPLIERG